ncbi:MAG: DMT family transporter [Anaerolineales bacterium]|nr:DMT family transporter [Anaerolineales bacterium]
MTSPPSHTPTSPAWQWLALALASQLGWGAYPALLRYLQTVSNLPGLSLLAAGNLLVLLLGIALILPRVDRRIFRQPILWLFGVLVILRGVTNLLATRFTLAVYAQLIYLLTPFIVALLSRLVLRERLPRHTLPALLLSLTGVFLMMRESLLATAVSPTPTRNDPLGISLALASSGFLALYMLVTRRTARRQAPGEALLLVHLLSLFAFSALASLLLGEDWQRWRALEATDWLVFAAFSLGVLLSANLGQIRTIQQLGAPLVSSLMPIRLVSALLVAGLLLGERLTSVGQLLGAGIVIVTLTWYLRQQGQRMGSG